MKSYYPDESSLSESHNLHRENTVEKVDRNLAEEIPSHSPKLNSDSNISKNFDCTSGNSSRIPLAPSLPPFLLSKTGSVRNKPSFDKTFSESLKEIQLRRSSVSSKQELPERFCSDVQVFSSSASGCKSKQLDNVPSSKADGLLYLSNSGILQHLKGRLVCLLLFGIY